MTTERQTIRIKPLGGIAGDMFVAACAALRPEHMEQCLADVRAAGLPGGVPVRFDDVVVNGFAACAFTVGPDSGPVVPTGDYAKIVAQLQDSALSAPVRTVALEILRLLGEAEAAVHDKSLDHVHFHELADWDSIADIVAASSFIAAAPETRWICDPLPMGGGRVETQHGQVTVPAPAVLKLLEGYAFIDDGIGGERVTPTGAAIVRYLTEAGDAPVAGRLTGSGFGAGTRRYPGMANVVQLVAFADAPLMQAETVSEIAFDIDDMTPEEIGVALDRLRAAPGVLDVTQTAQTGKKGRMMVLVRVLATQAMAEDVIGLCFTETSTLGVRIGDVQRRVLKREARATPDGAAKIATRPGGARTAKTESDDLAGVAGLGARRDQAKRAEQAALAGEDDG